MYLNILSETDILNNCDAKTPKWSFQGLSVNAKCVKVYDGDTATFVFIPHSGGKPRSFSCRLVGYNSAELKSKDPNEKAIAIASRDYLTSLILNKIVELKLGSFDKYGRILVDVYLPITSSCTVMSLTNDILPIHVNAHMIKAGYGKLYNGTGPKTW